jgi:hypothetical protein
MRIRAVFAATAALGVVRTQWHFFGADLMREWTGVLLVACATQEAGTQGDALGIVDFGTLAAAGASAESVEEEAVGHRGGF